MEKSLRLYSLNTTVLKSLRFLEANSKLAVFLCFLQSSPSELKIPSPNKTSIYEWYVSPLLHTKKKKKNIDENENNTCTLVKELVSHLWVVGEIGFEDVFDIDGICYVCVSGEGHRNHYGSRVVKILNEPVVHSVKVSQLLNGCSDQRPCLGTSLVPLSPSVQEDP